MFFLTVHDIVAFRGAAKTSCAGAGAGRQLGGGWMCLGITAADPMHSHPLLERFIGVERRHEPPDIDVDFEHERGAR